MNQLICHIVISLVTGVLAGVVATLLYGYYRRKSARCFYKNYCGIFQESLKANEEKLRWTDIEISLKGDCQLEVIFKDNDIDKGTAVMKLEGSLDKSTNFKATYSHNKNGIQYWGHYELFFESNDRIIGTMHYEKEFKLVFLAIEWKRNHLKRK